MRVRVEVSGGTVQSVSFDTDVPTQMEVQIVDYDCDEDTDEDGVPCLIALYSPANNGLPI